MVVLCGLEHYIEGRHCEYLHGTLANDDEKGNGKQNATVFGPIEHAL